MLSVVVLLGVVGVRQWVGTPPEQRAPAGTSTSAPALPAGDRLARVPEDFRAACGRPGAVVRLRTSPLTIRVDKSDCDLTGVSVLSDNGSALVPEPGTGVGVQALQVDADEDGYSVRWLGPVGPIGNQ